MNIIELIESQLDDRFTQTATRETGLSADQTRTATRAAIPALLASLLSAFSKPGGMKALGSLLKDQGLFGNLSSSRAASASRTTNDTGLGALTSLLGEGKLSGLVNAISGFSGIGANQSRSLIGMLFPIVMGVLGREQRGTPSADGITRLLKSQRHEIASAMPASVASSLRSTGLLDALDEEPAARRTTTTTAADETAPRSTTTMRRPAERRRGNWFWPVAAGIVAVALVAWGVTRLGDDEQETRTAADTATDDTNVAVAPSDAALTVGGVDLGEELTSVVDRATRSLSTVTDARTAEAALPTLSEINDDLDAMTPMIDRLPDPARNAFADLARNSHARVAAQVDRIESIQSVPDNVKQAARELAGKIESFFTRGRG